MDDLSRVVAVTPRVDQLWFFRSSSTVGAWMDADGQTHTYANGERTCPPTCPCMTEMG